MMQLCAALSGRVLRYTYKLRWPLQVHVHHQVKGTMNLANVQYAVARKHEPHDRHHKVTVDSVSAKMNLVIGYDE